MKTKFNQSLELCNAMTIRLPFKRPNCEEILNRKSLWTLNEEELEISDELKNIIASKECENELIYSMRRSEINLIESEPESKLEFSNFDSYLDLISDPNYNSSSDSSSEAVTLKRSRSPEQIDEVSQQKRRTQGCSIEKGPLNL